MNNSTLTRDTSTNGESNDVFRMQMLYDQTDTGIGNTAYYNGRLSAVKWMSRDATSAKTAERSYKYNYDELNRLNDALYSEKPTGGSWTATGAFDEKAITYDENGNILTLKRNGLLGNAVTKIDSLVYSYDGNKLSNVTDGMGTNYTANGFKNLTAYTGTTLYDYDVNGNITTDCKKGISNDYNILNRVKTVTVATGQYITYTYDATGTLLRKQKYLGGTLQLTTDYIDGFVFENSTLAYFPAAEGRVRNSSGTLTNEYVITDTQGNSRISFEDNGTGVAIVRQENSYYPFGLIMSNGITPSTQPNKNLYNAGSEWQNDYSDLPDYYATFYRNYDATVGRFTGVDPQAVSADSWTTYQYAYNNPGMLNDPMGDLTKEQFGAIINTLGNSEFGGHWTSREPGVLSMYGDEEIAKTFSNIFFDAHDSYGANEGWAVLTMFGQAKRAPINFNDPIHDRGMLPEVKIIGKAPTAYEVFNSRIEQGLDPFTGPYGDKVSAWYSWYHPMYADYASKVHPAIEGIRGHITGSASFESFTVGVGVARDNQGQTLTFGDASVGYSPVPSAPGITLGLDYFWGNKRNKPQLQDLTGGSRGWDANMEPFEFGQSFTQDPISWQRNTGYDINYYGLGNGGPGGISGGVSRSKKIF